MADCTNCGCDVAKHNRSYSVNMGKQVRHFANCMCDNCENDVCPSSSTDPGGSIPWVCTHRGGCKSWCMHPSCGSGCALPHIDHLQYPAAWTQVNGGGTSPVVSSGGGGLSGGAAPTPVAAPVPPSPPVYRVARVSWQTVSKALEAKDEWLDEWDLLPDA